MMEKNYMAAIAACSNGLPAGKRQELQRLAELLEQNDISVRMSRYLYEKSDGIDFREADGKKQKN